MDGSVMRFNGHLGTWLQDQGHGFITPTQGGDNIIVHESALPYGPNRPVVGDALSFEIELDRDGRKQAVRVLRIAAPARPAARTAPPAHAAAGPWRRRALVLVLVAGVGFGYAQVSRWMAERQAPPVEAAADEAPARALSREQVREAQPAAPAAASFRCDGRRHCTQMTSCAEATFFLRHCPDTKMDGDRDGIPCEEQWCTDPRGR